MFTSGEFSISPLKTLRVHNTQIISCQYVIWSYSQLLFDLVKHTRTDYSFSLFIQLRSASLVDKPVQKKPTAVNLTRLLIDPRKDVGLDFDQLGSVYLTVQQVLRG